MDMHDLAGSAEYADQVIHNTQGILDHAQQWMGSFIQADQDKNKVIHGLLKQLEEQIAQRNQLNRDLASERMSRNQFQVESQNFEMSLQKIQQKINEASFIAVLIDGDGAKFADEYIRNPTPDGVSRAAQNLKQAVRDHLNDYPDPTLDLNSDDIPILIRAYANLNGLANSLRLSNVIDRDEDLRLFAEYCTNQRAEFDFVNVGRGKENADSKIRKLLKHYLKNIQCKKIFVACCHDNGYLHDLRGYSDISDYRKKLVLVETTPAEPGFKALGIPVTRFDKVFRAMPLDNETKRTGSMLPFNMRPLSMPVQPYATPVSAAYSSVDSQIAAAINSPFSQPLPPPIAPPHLQQPPMQPIQPMPPTPQQQNSQPRFVPTPASSDSTPASAPAGSEVEPQGASRAPSIVQSGNGGISVTYSTAGGAKGHQNITIKPAKPKKELKVILYNEEGCRIDPPTKHPANTPAQATYQAKLEKIAPNAFCNDHYLIGRCNRADCHRIHNVDLTAPEISIHRYKARTSVCPRGPECDDYDCYLSHHCLKDPRCSRGNSCKFTNTDFGNLHLDSLEKLQPAVKWTEGNDFPENYVA